MIKITGPNSDFFKLFNNCIHILKKEECTLLPGMTVFESYKDVYFENLPPYSLPSIQSRMHDPGYLQVIPSMAYLNDGVYELKLALTNMGKSPLKIPKFFTLTSLMIVTTEMINNWENEYVTVMEEPDCDRY